MLSLSWVTSCMHGCTPNIRVRSDPSVCDLWEKVLTLAALRGNMGTFFKGARSSKKPSVLKHLYRRNASFFLVSLKFAEGQAGGKILFGGDNPLPLLMAPLPVNNPNEQGSLSWQSSLWVSIWFNTLHTQLCHKGTHTYTLRRVEMAIHIKLKQY